MSPDPLNSEVMPAPTVCPIAEPTATPPAVAAICWNIEGCWGAGMPTALGGAETGAGGGGGAAARAGTGAGAGAGALLQLESSIVIIACLFADESYFSELCTFIGQEMTIYEIILAFL